MAVVGNRRRHQTLTLELPLAPTSTRLPPPSAPSTTSTPLSDYDKLEVLGHGDGGTVYKVRHRATSSLFALKLLRPDRRHAREFTALRLASSSPLVVRCHAFLSDSALLLEFMDAGTLLTLLRRHRRLPPSSLPYLSRRVLLALSHLHSLHIVHRDVKPSNILVDSTGEIKISDFGVSRVMTRSLDPCDSYVGTCAYMSPERFDPETYGAKYDGYAADVWSLGLTVMELYLGRFPLVPKGERPDWATLMCAICFGEPPSLPDSASPELRSFVDSCLRKEPGKRLSVAQLLDHPFVSGDLSDSKNAFLELL